MRALLDTNVFLRHSLTADARQPAITAALDALLADGTELCICSQNIVEYWALSTRPVNANGLGKSPAQVRREIDSITPGFSLIPDPAELLAIWLNLCTTFEVRGRQAYDARLVALMSATAVTTLVTLNPADFSRFATIKLVIPAC